MRSPNRWPQGRRRLRYSAIGSRPEGRTHGDVRQRTARRRGRRQRTGRTPAASCRRAAARHGRRRPWPAWAEPDVVRAFTDRGISSPWAHQVEAADWPMPAHVVISTGTASGKSLAYQLPILNALATDPRARALYLSPTKALGHDQLRAAHALTAAIPRLGDVAPRPTTVTVLPRCDASRASDRGGCSPTPIWSTWRCCATMPGGRCFCAAFAT